MNMIQRFFPILKEELRSRWLFYPLAQEVAVKWDLFPSIKGKE